MMQYTPGNKEVSTLSKECQDWVLPYWMQYGSWWDSSERTSLTPVLHMLSRSKCIGESGVLLAKVLEKVAKFDDSDCWLEAYGAVERIQTDTWAVALRAIVHNEQSANAGHLGSPTAPNDVRDSYKITFGVLRQISQINLWEVVWNELRVLGLRDDRAAAVQLNIVAPVSDALLETLI